MTKLYLFLLLLFNLSCTIFFYLTGTYESIWNYLYNLTVALNYVLAAVYLIQNISLFPKFKSVFLLFIAGYLSTFTSLFIWFLYNTVFNEAVPFPSVADIFWILFYPFVAAGLALLLKRMKTPLNWVNSVEILVLSSILFTIITTFLNINRGVAPTLNAADLVNTLYTGFDSFLIALSIITLRNQKNVKNQSLLYLTFGLLTLSIADTVFAYQTAKNIYWNGNLSDLLFAVSGFLFGLSSLSINATLKSHRGLKISDSFVE